MKSFISITFAALFVSVALAAPQSGTFMGFSLPPSWYAKLWKSHKGYPMTFLVPLVVLLLKFKAQVVELFPVCQNTVTLLGRTSCPRVGWACTGEKFARRPHHARDRFSDIQIIDISCVCKAEKVVAALKTCVPAKCKPDEVAKFEPTINYACKGEAPQISYMYKTTNLFFPGVAGYPMKLGAWNEAA